MQERTLKRMEPTVASPQSTEPAPRPHRKTRRRLYAAIAVIGFLLFIVGWGCFWTSYSDNPPLLNLGIGFIAVGGLLFLVFGIKWRNSRRTRPAPPASPAPSKLQNGTP